ncbi:MAG: hypothetical protein RLZZ337_839 [Bacteroidota bacterium]|jgi:hypothetical protein
MYRIPNLSISNFVSMNKIIFTCLSVCLFLVAQAQNLEFINGKDIRQPGKVNPSLAGVQEDLVRILTDANINNSYQIGAEGKLPFKLGNYMVGYERLFNDNVNNNIVNLTYARTNKKDKKLQYRYGATVNLFQKNFLKADYDTATNRYRFTDLNGEVQTVPTLQDVNTNVDYFDIKLGGSVTYRFLMAGVSVDNFIGQDVSLSKVDIRKVPFTTNFIIGGFFGIGDKLTVFPSVVAVLNSDNMYTKASADVATEKLLFSASYLLQDEITNLNATVGYKFKKTLVGIKYTQPLAGQADALPGINLFLNSTPFKSRDLFKSDFAKKIRRFY